MVEKAEKTKQTGEGTHAPFVTKEAPSIFVDNGSISYSDFLLSIQRGAVRHVVLSANMRVAKATMITKEGVQDFRVVLPEDYDILNFLLSNSVHVTISETNTLDAPKNSVKNNLETIGRMGVAVLQIIFELALIGMLIQFVISSRGGMGGSGGMFGNGGVTSSRATMVDSTMIDTRFTDVAGADNAKRELAEVVDFLKNPEKYTKLGAKIPKGVLLHGPPGCGKTLLARSVAGEAGVPFFSTSGSSMVELFVGVAAARVRDMFQKAKQVAPCIIFIDEIDAIGKARSMTLSTGGNDERDQALNQLLTEMDGFEGNHGVIVIAATNRPDILDDALTRPGRFDRRVTVEYPDLQGRTEILGVHTRGMPLDDGIQLGKLARNTIGFTGADLKNLCNEAAIYAARGDCETIQNVHFDKSLEKLTMGEEHTTIVVSEQKRRIVAYHEAGHTLLALLVSEFDNIRKVSITPRGNSGGATYFEPSEERIDGSLVTREYLENKLVVALGGRVAEEIVFGQDKATTGAVGDLEVVTSIATDMVCKYGFNEEIGPIQIDEGGLGADAEAEVRLHVERAYIKAIALMKEQEFYLHRIAEALLEKETLQEHEVLQLVGGISCNLESSNSIH
jgi:cell division protease FtsH